MREPMLRTPSGGSAHGFTIVELVVVMVLVGILGAIGAERFFTAGSFDASSYTEQLRAMVRYAQKLAIAQNRNVFVEGSLDGVALCYTNALPCPATSQVPAPAGANSGNDSTRAFCSVGDAYAASWYCEGRPANVTMTAGGSALSPFFFNGLGRPYLPADLPPGPDTAVTKDSSFTGLSVTVAAEGSTATLAVAPDTGYVN